MCADDQASNSQQQYFHRILLRLFSFIQINYAVAIAAAQLWPIVLINLLITQWYYKYRKRPQAIKICFVCEQNSN